MGEVPAAHAPRALDLAFRYLNRRERTVLEMRRYLESKRVEPAAIEEALAELQETGYLDDAAYALRFADDKRRLEQWGPDRIERRLRAAGVDPEHIRVALAEQDRDSELDTAVDILRRRAPGRLDDARSYRRALGILVRKGYDAELAADAIRRAAPPE